MVHVLAPVEEAAHLYLLVKQPSIDELPPSVARQKVVVPARMHIEKLLILFERHKITLDIASNLKPSALKNLLSTMKERLGEFEVMLGGQDLTLDIRRDASLNFLVRHLARIWRRERHPLPRHSHALSSAFGGFVLTVVEIVEPSCLERESKIDDATARVISGLKMIDLDPDPDDLTY